MTADLVGKSVRVRAGYVGAGHVFVVSSVTEVVRDPVCGHRERQLYGRGYGPVRECEVEVVPRSPYAAAPGDRFYCWHGGEKYEGTISARHEVHYGLRWDGAAPSGDYRGAALQCLFDGVDRGTGFVFGLC